MNDKLIIIPAYNESESILGTVNDIVNKTNGFDYVVINDCSKDDTLKICKENKLNYVSLPVNLGIGGAVQTGYKYALENGYKVAVQVDGDGQHDPAFLEKMYEVMERADADMVIGSRFIENEGFQSSFARRMGISFFVKLIKLLTRQKVTDPTSGLRMVNRDLIEIFANDYPRDYPEPESLVKAILCGKKVIEIPVIMLERQGGQSSIQLKKSIYYMIKVSLAIIIECFRKHK